MARKIKIAAAIINVRVHPHSAEHYTRLLRAVLKLRVPAQVHGDRYGLVSYADFRGVSDGFVKGTVTTFTQFDSRGAWFDAERLQEPTDEQMAEVSIPPGLFPNAASYFFHFDLASHRMYFETYSRGNTITPKSVLRLVRGLLEHPKILQEFGQPSVSLVQRKEGLERLFSIDRIKRIDIELEKPNADVFDDDLEEKLEEYLKESNTQKLTISYIAESGKSIVATPSIKRVSEAALENGSVSVRGRDEGVAVSRSSRDFPEVLQETYDPDLTTEQQAFDRMIAK
jgi:hypothetical protein